MNNKDPTCEFATDFRRERFMLQRPKYIIGILTKRLSSGPAWLTNADALR